MRKPHGQRWALAHRSIHQPAYAGRSPGARAGRAPGARAGRAPRAGLSLLEVILAIAILGGCIAVIGELVRLGARQAEEARELTTAQLLCESKLEEIAAGAVAPESVGDVPFENDPSWAYSIDVASLDNPDLIQVTVTAHQIDGSRLVPLSFSLTRWMIDPNLELELMMLGTESSAESAASGSATESGAGASTGGL